MGNIYDSFNFPEVTEEVAKKMGLSSAEFSKACELIGRVPNYIELGCISAMWSEHCSYKSSKIHLSQLPSSGKDVVYGPGENAGVVRVDVDICVCFKIESHNHPSYHDPFNGAATGVGGILRDVFTMGARPVAALNSLRMGDPEFQKTKGILKGAIDGMADYGNRFGVPMVGGELSFHKSFNTNPLVNAFVLGVVKEDKIFTAAASGIGNSVMYIGKKTGREGILGAAMASEEIGEGANVDLPVSQKGDPIKEKHLMEACLELMQGDAIAGIQDMGAAGLTSTSFEMADKAGAGVKLYLDKVPMAEEGMNPYELMLSESQERMLLVAKKGRESEIIKVLHKWDLDAAVIGEVTSDGYVRLYWKEEEVANLEASPLSENAPRYNRPYKRPEWLDKLSEFDPEAIKLPDLEKAFLNLLQDPTIASKKWAWDHFKHNSKDILAVNGGDAAVISIEGSKKGVAMAVDCNSRYCYLDPFRGAQLAVGEAARNVASTGAKPIAITNCLNYGSPEKEDGMYQMVEGIKGLGLASEVLDIPVVSGNVSLYNETDGRSIYPTPSIVVVGVIEDAKKAIGSFFKKNGNKIYTAGTFADSIDASHYLETQHGVAAGAVPHPNLDWHKKLFKFMEEATSNEVIVSAHDTSEGGFSVALFEMCSKNMLGAKVHIPASGRADAALFGEKPQMIFEVSPEKASEFELIAQMNDFRVEGIGEVGGDSIEIMAQNKILLSINLEKASQIYNDALFEMMKGL